MPEVVISNTSPIFYLHRLRRLDLLQKLYIARLRGLRVTGTAGVLLKAKQEGHILAVKPFLDRLQEIHFHLSDNVRALILSIAEE